MNGPGMALATLRAQTGLSVRQAARRAQVGRKYLRKVERGQAVASPAWLGHVATHLSAALVERATGSAGRTS